MKIMTISREATTLKDLKELPLMTEMEALTFSRFNGEQTFVMGDDDIVYDYLLEFLNEYGVQLENDNKGSEVNSIASLAFELSKLRYFDGYKAFNKLWSNINCITYYKYYDCDLSAENKRIVFKLSKLRLVSEAQARFGITPTKHDVASQRSSKATCMGFAVN